VGSGPRSFPRAQPPFEKPRARGETWLPAAGRYRVLLVAFTDLPDRGDESRRWERADVDDGEAGRAAGRATRDTPLSRRDYRVGVYVYVYQSGASNSKSAFWFHTTVPLTSRWRRRCCRHCSGGAPAARTGANDPPAPNAARALLTLPNKGLQVTARRATPEPGRWAA
jgi:hypothetical protein